MTDTGVQRRTGSTWALAAQVGLVAGSLANGLLLARGSSLTLRGLTVVFSTSLSVGVLVVTAGLPELMLRFRTTRASSRLRTTALALSVVVACCSGVLASIAVDGGTLLALLVAVLVMGSCWNAALLSVLLIRQGLRRVSVVRTLYAGWLVGGTLTAYVATEGRLTPATIVGSMCAAEALTCALLVCWVLGTPADLDERALGVRDVLRQGPSHVLAGLGSLFADRGVVLLTSAAGGLAATALVSVTQSASSTAGIPASAFGPSILLEAETRSGSTGRPRRWSSRALWTSAVASVVTVPASYFLLVPLYGPQYADLQAQAGWIGVLGFLTAYWRIAHLALRGEGRPTAALLTDGCALTAVALVFWLGDIGPDVPGIVLMMLVYAGVGALSGFVLRRRPEPSGTPLTSERVEVVAHHGR